MFIRLRIEASVPRISVLPAHLDLISRICKNNKIYQDFCRLTEINEYFVKNTGSYKDKSVTCKTCVVLCRTKN